MIEIDSATIARFWARVRKTDNCWTWPSRFLPQGYGRYGFKRNCKRYDFTAHRFAWVATYGQIPDGMFVLHRCDNPPCVRPDHLFLGTHADNMVDMSEKGRSKRGAQATGAVLTDDKVREIHARYSAGANQEELAKEFAVSRASVGLIVTGKTWRHLNLDPIPRYNFGGVKGETHGAARLTEKDVLAIRESYTTGVRVGALASQYGMSHGAISLIISRKTWKHI